MKSNQAGTGHHQDQPSSETRLAMLGQMAEALEDEAAGLDRRAATLAGMEELVIGDIQDHETEINRLSLKLKALQSERESLVQRIATLRAEALNLREQLSTAEDDLALDSLPAPARGLEPYDPVCERSDPFQFEFDVLGALAPSKPSSSLPN